MSVVFAFAVASLLGDGFISVSLPPLSSTPNVSTSAASAPRFPGPLDLRFQFSTSLPDGELLALTATTGAQPQAASQSSQSPQSPWLSLVLEGGALVLRVASGTGNEHQHQQQQQQQQLVTQAALADARLHSVFVSVECARDRSRRAPSSPSAISVPCELTLVVDGMRVGTIALQTAPTSTFTSSSADSLSSDKRSVSPSASTRLQDTVRVGGRAFRGCVANLALDGEDLFVYGARKRSPLSFSSSDGASVPVVVQVNAHVSDRCSPLLAPDALSEFTLSGTLILYFSRLHSSQATYEVWKKHIYAAGRQSLIRGLSRRPADAASGFQSVLPGSHSCVRWSAPPLQLQRTYATPSPLSTMCACPLFCALRNCRRSS